MGRATVRRATVAPSHQVLAGGSWAGLLVCRLVGWPPHWLAALLAAMKHHHPLLSRPCHGRALSHQALAGGSYSPRGIYGPPTKTMAPITSDCLLPPGAGRRLVGRDRPKPALNTARARPDPAGRLGREPSPHTPHTGKKTSRGIDEQSRMKKTSRSIDDYLAPHPLLGDIWLSRLIGFGRKHLPTCPTPSCCETSGCPDLVSVVSPPTQGNKTSRGIDE